MQYIIHGSVQAEQGKGGNIIPEAEKKGVWRLFLEKFTDPIIIILLVVLSLSTAISLYEIIFTNRAIDALIEPLGIFIAIILATGLAFWFEHKAEKEFLILNKKKDERPVKVLRLPSNTEAEDAQSPRMFLIAKSDVCKGDIVQLESGDEVPADGYVLEALCLKVDESNFTGEMYANKQAGEASEDEQCTYPSNFLLRGSTIIEGNCTYCVSDVGVDTQEGKGAMLLRNEQEIETPLNRQLNRLAGHITKISYIIAALIFIGRMSYWFASVNEITTVALLEFALSSLLIAVTLIVVAVPEGLPMSVTISLALSMRKMLKENNLVRRLHACETMGATTVICTDKTGTLTKNRMEVNSLISYISTNEEVEENDLISASIALNSTAELSESKVLGNPTEGALLKWLEKSLGIDYSNLRRNASILGREPFSTEKKYMSTDVALANGRRIRLIKGAPEIVLSRCNSIGFNNSTTTETVLKTLSQFQSKGFRTLGFAYSDITPDSNEEQPLTYIATAAISDPVREDVKDAILTCAGAGVRVIVVTGDVPLTANQIAVDAGILNPDQKPQSLTGVQFSQMSDSQIMEEVLPNLKVLSRARPEDKLRLVSLLQQCGEVVAVTGDGTNDALALKKAQVGLSMGDGTSRAKEASDITIIDNSFASINKGILWGRSLYMNIKRFILFQMTINVCACLVLLLGAFIGIESPLTVTQMLWVNLIMDTFAAMALASLPPDKRVMREKPRNPKAHIIDRAMAITILLSGFTFFAILSALWSTLHNEGELSPYKMGIFFTSFVMLQFWNIFNARYFRTGRSLFADLIDTIRHPGNAGEHFSIGFISIAMFIIAGQLLITQIAWPFFNVAPLSARTYITIILATMPVLLIPDIVRHIRFRARQERITHI